MEPAKFKNRAGQLFELNSATIPGLQDTNISRKQKRLQSQRGAKLRPWGSEADGDGAGEAPWFTGDYPQVRG